MLKLIYENLSIFGMAQTIVYFPPFTEANHRVTKREETRFEYRSSGNRTINNFDSLILIFFYNFNTLLCFARINFSRKTTYHQMVFLRKGKTVLVFLFSFRLCNETCLHILLGYFSDTPAWAQYCTSQIIHLQHSHEKNSLLEAKI